MFADFFNMMSNPPYKSALFDSSVFYFKLPRTYVRLVSFVQGSVELFPKFLPFGEDKVFKIDCLHMR